ncbi:hypothetical protein N781_05215 [Pontibacillus halophilus JSM 076056 = DSM 19796]|uniref:Family 2 glycosyl transferase n=1 Tax=Pontibacillus halophilus JSM 076056 = DSM 19796 TaxID=1385510 RepID=A0A0A5GGJ1_9BACI|nr:hypothetical protein N781_05215 [Pontibacillus halophilus JSM 076056 = DSM 19796]
MEGWIIRRKGKWLALWLLSLGVLTFILFDGFKVIESQELEDGTKLKFRTSGEQLQVYKEDSWSPMFIKGVNIGATLPGHYPGELPVTKEDYLSWFRMIQDMGANTVRVYTILDPVFYEALVEFNENQEDPLYFMQGVWSPVNLLAEHNNAWQEDVVHEFKAELHRAVDAVYGDAEIPEEPGKASGSYTVNAAPYLIAWHIGTEWDPEMVNETNEKNVDRERFEGEYFQVDETASPFEGWLAEMLEYTAELEEEKGWKHPMTFTNWITTDPLTHPDEPSILEDYVSVDATHVEAKDWDAGYFASYHVYPYYPDFLRFTDTYQDVHNADGKEDTYLGYLKDLKQYHKGMPIIISEYGVASSTGNAHEGPLGRDQGGHTEEEQGTIDAQLTNQIYDSGYAGAITFSWQDEWFKETWNSLPYEQSNRTAYWYNPLSNEMSYGLIGMYPSKTEEIDIDGKASDWDDLQREEVESLQVETPGVTEMDVTHDEGFVYLKLTLSQPYNRKTDTLNVGFHTLEGGTSSFDSVEFNEGLETMAIVGSDEQEVKVACSYDFHTRLYEDQMEGEESSCAFVPWKLPTSLKQHSSKTEQAYPFQDVGVGELVEGRMSQNGESAWAASGDTIELKIPWALLGFSDPSQRMAVSYEDDSNASELSSEAVEGITVVPWVMGEETNGLLNERPLSVSELPMYEWERWDEVQFIEKPKESYSIMKDVFQRIPEKGEE